MSHAERLPVSRMARGWVVNAGFLPVNVWIPFHLKMLTMISLSTLAYLINPAFTKQFVGEFGKLLGSCRSLRIIA